MKNRYVKTEIEGVNDRREFLKLAGYGTLGLIAGSYLPSIEDCYTITGFLGFVQIVGTD